MSWTKRLRSARQSGWSFLVTEHPRKPRWPPRAETRSTRNDAEPHLDVLRGRSLAQLRSALSCTRSSGARRLGHRLLSRNRAVGERVQGAGAGPGERALDAGPGVGPGLVVDLRPPVPGRALGLDLRRQHPAV